MRRGLSGPIVALAAMIAVVAVVFAGLYGYATTLPAEHTAQVEVVVPADPYDVEMRVRDWRAAASWKHDVTRVEDLGVVDGFQRYRECASECLDIQIEDDDDTWVTRIVDNPDFGGTWTWEFLDDPEGTRVVLTEDGEVPNPIFRLFVHHVFGVDANIRATAKALRRSFTE